MQLKKRIMILAMINFNLGMNNDNENPYNQNLIQRNPNETEMSDMVNPEGSTEINNLNNSRIILIREINGNNSENMIYLDTQDFLFHYTEDELNNLWNRFERTNLHPSQFNNFLNNQPNIYEREQRRVHKNIFCRVFYYILNSLFLGTSIISIILFIKAIILKIYFINN
jgi:hypothetical protein